MTLTIGTELDDKALLASALISVGAEYLLQGDHEQGAMLNEEPAGLYRDRGNRGTSSTPSTTWDGQL